jgi:hypothetical protein
VDAGIEAGLPEEGFTVGEGEMRGALVAITEISKKSIIWQHNDK